MGQIITDIERPLLALVATPIGNLKDVSARALDTLRASDLILAEDTRVSKRLLDAYSIDGPMLAVHDHNEREVASRLVSRIVNERLIASLISDAGMPLISDPGYLLIRAAHQVGLKVTVIPGPCAAITALAMSGLPADGFAFAGFLPSRSGARRARLAELSRYRQTLILYEAPHRLLATLEDARDVLGGAREIFIARELTKAHETSYRGTLANIGARLAADEHAAQGELVLIIGPAPEPADDVAQLTESLRAALRYLSPRDAATLVCEITGAKRNAVYRLCLDLAARASDTAGG
jgi:16S rRNA (cytidine1402-2'-O)-methyltransferase